MILGGLALVAALGIAALVAVLGCGGTTDPPRSGGEPPEDPPPTIPLGPYVPGESYFGRNNYIEYVAGNAPLIYSAPHGGALLPSEIPDRTASRCGTEVMTNTDLNTIELVRAMQARHFARFGTYPHLIINHLGRRKLDANRADAAAACGDAEALIALGEWHEFIDIAKTAVTETSARGWYMDMHGHGHSIQRLELGYLLTGAQLDRSDLSSLAAADALASLTGHRREALWETLAVDEPTRLALPATIVAPPPLAAPTEGQEIVGDYETMGLTLRRHPLALLRERLKERCIRSAEEVAESRHGQFIRTAGIVTCRQRPATASGVTMSSCDAVTSSCSRRRAMSSSTVPPRAAPEASTPRPIASHGFSIVLLPRGYEDRSQARLPAPPMRPSAITLNMRTCSSAPRS